MEISEEPLNLTLKKMPIAIVAPFSVVENKIINNNETDSLNLNKCEELPEDLSLKKNNEECLDLTKNKNHCEQLRKYLCKNEQTRNSYEKNTFNDYYNNKLAPRDNPQNIFDNNFLSMWYVNSFLNQQNPYFNTSPQAYQPKPNTNPASNKILNNLLDKKTYSSYKFPSSFDSLIKNEMQSDSDDKESTTG
ncbi:uncharacterized protein [Diabrotica undecimpunctata]|uniref:uncharacterized protein n=1 Tax=Diabrotica undecimpunctata TaxID=50387 RepID=UPI003B6362FA